MHASCFLSVHEFSAVTLEQICVPNIIYALMDIVPPFSVDFIFLKRCIIKPLTALFTHGERLPVDYVALFVFVYLSVSVFAVSVFLCL